MSEVFLNNVYEMLRTILPAIITAIGTFFVTKYSYHKNIPLDKLEISYNRVYYPICYLIKNEEDSKKVVEKCELYFKKYHKYVDRTTRIVFENLKVTRDPQQKYSMRAYNRFKNNILEMDARLRRRLGYLEPDILNLYKYAPAFEKQMLRISIEGLLLYMSVFIVVLVQEKSISNMLMVIIVILFIVFFFECIILLLQLAWKGVNKLVDYIRRK